MPGINPMEFTPEDETIFPEDASDGMRIHTCEISDGTYVKTKAIRTPTTDEWDFTDGECAKYIIDLIAVPEHGRAEGFMEVTEHFGADASIRYADGYRDADIVIDIEFEVFGECIVFSCHPTHGREGFIDREYFEFPETSLEISHEAF
jgi:hypothetical protein